MINFICKTIDETTTCLNRGACEIRNTHVSFKSNSTRYSPPMDSILDQFPKVDHAFAYGSGVFHQPGLYSSGKKSKQPVLDFIFTVQDPIAWHQEVRCT